MRIFICLVAFFLGGSGAYAQFICYDIPVPQATDLIDVCPGNNGLIAYSYTSYPSTTKVMHRWRDYYGNILMDVTASEAEPGVFRSIFRAPNQGVFLVSTYLPGVCESDRSEATIKYSQDSQVIPPVNLKFLLAADKTTFTTLNVCDGEKVNVIAHATGTGVTYAWFGPDGQRFSGAEEINYAFSAGKYTVVATGTNTCRSGTASTSSSFQVNVGTVAAPAIRGPLTVRKGNSTDVFTINAPGASDVGYQWMLDGVLVGTSASFIVPLSTKVGSHKVSCIFSANYTGLCTTRKTVTTADVLFYFAGNVTDQDANLIEENTVLKEGVLSPGDIDNLAVGDRQQNTRYFDGLGRPIQTVTTQNSPGKRDMVQPVGYDPFGRETRKYLPVVAGTDGWYKANLLDAKGDLAGDAANFYNNSDDAITDDPRPYSELVFENSPLNRPLAAYGVGQSWYQNAKSINYQYLSNVHGTAVNAEKIVAWKIDDMGGLIRELPLAGLIESGGYYSSNQLIVNVTVDEENHAIREYKDKTGNVILKKVQSLQTATDLNNRDQWALTYYVYDDFGNLRYVLQPELSKVVHQNDVYTPTAADLNNFAFQYTYDGRRRMATKKVPGSDWVYMVYDKRDRMVLSQDGNQRASATKYWSFTKYDALDRAVLTGVKDTLVVLSQREMQSVVDQFYQTKSWATISEDYRGATGIVYGYTNKTYPVVTAAAVLDVNRYLTVQYYDTYDFISLWNQVQGTYKYHNDALSTAVNSVTYNQPAVEYGWLTGQKTGGRVKVLDGGVSGGYTWLTSVTYYDDNYRPIQSITDNYKGGVDRVSNLYDFGGKILMSQSTHQTSDVARWKDLVGVSIAGNIIARTVTGSSWGVSGLASVDFLPANTDGWVEFIASEENTLRMLGLSATNADANYPSIGYAFYLRNDKTLLVYEGTSKGQITGGYKSGDILRIQRVGTRIKYFRNGIDVSPVDPTQKVSSSPLYVDIAMGTGQSTFVNVRSSFTSKSNVLTKRFTYDHAGRLVSEFYRLDGQNEVELTRNEYNELGQLIDKKLHGKTGAPFKQSVDYRYNIRGWLTNINDSQLSDGESDFFGMNLVYNDATTTGASALYNGNISAIKWSLNQGLSSMKEMAYNFSYDPMNRLTSAANLQSGASQDWQAGNYSEGGLQYDLNGNIKSLVRYGDVSGIMDNLAYNYGTTGAQSNQLLKVTDAGDKFVGFLDGTNTTNDYTYDANGNLLTDQNKGMSTAITYNYLNLPELVTRSVGTVRYIYDATGRKLSQVVTYGSLAKQTDYVNEFQYENDDLQFISHEEGRIVVSDESLVYSFDGTTIDPLTPVNATVTTLKANGDQTYILARATSATTRSGMFPIGGSFPVQPGERYRIRARGYRDKGSVATANGAYILAQANGVDLAWPGAALQSTASTEAWVEQIVIIPAGATELQVGVVWGTVVAGNTIYLNDFEITRLNDTEPEYQYFLKDHLGNVRVTFTTKEDVESSVATLEEENEQQEQGEFIYYNEAVKMNSNWFDHTNDGITATSGAVQNDPAGNALLLRGGANERYGLAKSLSVMPGDVIKTEVYAKYVDSDTESWSSEFAGVMSSIASGSNAAAIIDGGAVGSIGGAVFPFAGLITHAPDEGGPKAYLNWIVFDRNYQYRDGGFVALSEAAAESGQNVAHERLNKDLLIKEPGYIYIYLSNEGETPVDVFFDDFKVEHVESPVIQVADYYPFGLMFNSYARENTVPNHKRFNGIEEATALDLNVYTAFFRVSDPTIGRWWQIDPKVDDYYHVTPYNMMGNNPVNIIDPMGDQWKDPKNDGKMAKNISKGLDKANAALTKSNAKLDKQIAKAQSKGKTEKADRLRTQKSNNDQMIAENNGTKDKLVKMGDANEITKFTFRNSASGTEGETGPEGDVVVMSVLSSLGNRVHEVEHGYNFGIRKKWDEEWDQEVRAYRAQYSADRSGMPPSKGGAVSEIGDITGAYVGGIMRTNADGTTEPVYKKSYNKYKASYQKKE